MEPLVSSKQNKRLKARLLDDEEVDQMAAEAEAESGGTEGEAEEEDDDR